jgi:hypothetical protein
LRIEFRSILPLEKFEILEKELEAHAKFLGNNDKEVYFFIIEGKLLKVSSNISEKECQDDFETQ